MPTNAEPTGDRKGREFLFRPGPGLAAGAMPRGRADSAAPPRPGRAPGGETSTGRGARRAGIGSTGARGVAGLNLSAPPHLGAPVVPSEPRQPVARPLGPPEPARALLAPPPAAVDPPRGGAPPSRFRFRKSPPSRFEIFSPPWWLWWDIPTCDDPPREWGHGVALWRPTTRAGMSHFVPPGGSRDVREGENRSTAEPPSLAAGKMTTTGGGFRRAWWPVSHSRGAPNKRRRG